MEAPDRVRSAILPKPGTRPALGSTRLTRRSGGHFVKQPMPSAVNWARSILRDRGFSLIRYCV